MIDNQQQTGGQIRVRKHFPLTLGCPTVIYLDTLMEQGYVVLLDNDEDDQLVFKRLMSELLPGYPVHCFDMAEDALKFLQNTAGSPFLIVSEMRLPGMDGIELRKAIEQDDRLRTRSIPFVYLTGTINERLVRQAYQFTIQGLFEKKVSDQQWKKQFATIIDYWQECVHPKRYETPAKGQ